jgi:Domain of Unknown Function with PDB structure (DUF3857)/Transglutaminase-like superfamily
MIRPVSILVLALTIITLQTRTAGQQKKATVTASARVTPSHAGLPSEFELLDTRYRFENDGTGRKEVAAKIRILNDQGIVQRSEMTFEFHPLSEELQIPYFRVRKKDGTVVKIDMVSGLDSATKVVGLFDYDEKRVRIPQLAAGDLIEYDVVLLIHRPLGSRQFWMQHYFQPDGVVDEQLEVDVPRARSIKARALPGIRSWETENGRRKIYHWENESSGSGEAVPISWRQSQTPDVLVSSFLSWEDVGRWYSELERSLRTPTPEVKAKADELTRGLVTEREKVEALYDFAAKRIKYISLASLGVEGYVPHSAAETLHNQYGDCKDKVALLSALLEAEEVHASSVLINPDREIDFDVPSPWPFTHVISMLKIEKEEIWMDPSPAVLPFRMLAYPLRGKQALVISPYGAAHFETTPADAPVPNTWSEEIEGSVNEDETLEATVNIIARGDTELSLREAFIGPIESVWPITVQGVIKGINRGVDKISNVTISDPTDTSVPFALSFRISRQHFIPLTERTAKFRLPLADFDLPAAEEQGVMDVRGGWHRIESEPVRLERGERSYMIKLRLPSGCSPELPPALTFEHQGGTYRAAYHWDGSSIIAERVLVVRQDRLPARLRYEYAGFRKKVLEDAERVVSVRGAYLKLGGQM